ncbi:MAG: hypothetical protein MJ193_05025 [Clostridia bacterium]|nr:hypothetical protein [Clostridia bacterium]
MIAGRIIVDAKSKTTILRTLDECFGVSSESLFDDSIDASCKAIAEHFKQKIAVARHTGYACTRNQDDNDQM